MSEEDEEKIRAMAEFKVTLDRRIKEMEDEIENLKIMRQLLETLLVEKGFKRAVIPPTPQKEISKTPRVTIAPLETKKINIVPIRTIEGAHLADMHIGEDEIRVIPSTEINFKMNTPPFRSFLIDRVLEKMRLKDKEASLRGEIPPDNILNYHIELEDETLREIYIENVTSERLHELRSTIRWTLEKMYEKMALK